MSYEIELPETGELVEVSTEFYILISLRSAKMLLNDSLVLRDQNEDAAVKFAEAASSSLKHAIAAMHDEKREAP